METTIVNVKTDEYDIYIGRENKSICESASRFANPFHITPSRNRTQTIEQYRLWFYRVLEKSCTFREQVEALRGKRLGCWCKPLPCHGDVIIEYLQSTEKVDLKFVEDVKSLVNENKDTELVLSRL
jgi:hypothetical protein